MTDAGAPKRPVLHLKFPRPAPAAAPPAPVAPVLAEWRQQERKASPAPSPPRPGRFRHEVVTAVDVSVDLAAQYRAKIVKSKNGALAESLVALTRDIAAEPRETRNLRLALAIIELLPEHPVATVNAALRACVAGGCDRGHGTIVGVVQHSHRRAAGSLSGDAVVGVADRRRKARRRRRATPCGQH